MHLGVLVLTAPTNIPLMADHGWGGEMVDVGVGKTATQFTQPGAAAFAIKGGHAEWCDQDAAGCQTQLQTAGQRDRLHY